MNIKKGIRVYGYNVYGVWNFPISLYLFSPIPICTDLSLSKYVLLSFIFILNTSSQLFAQQKNKIEKVYNNKITKDYVAIPGTKLSMFPPKGFESAKDFKGFRNSITGSSIMITTIPGNIKTNLMGFSKQALQNSGIFFIASDQFIINGFNATLIKAKQVAYQNSYLKWMLIIGNEKETYLVNGAYLEKLEKTESKPIFNSIMSIVFQPEKKVSTADGFPFELNIKNTKLKATKLITNAVIFTTDGLVPTKAKDKTALTASAILLPMKVNDYKKYCINSIKQYSSITEVPEKNISAVTIDNITGYEIHANGVNKLHGKAELIYQAILFDGDMSYSIVGIAIENFDENLKLFKNISKTFKRRK